MGRMPFARLTEVTIKTQEKFYVHHKNYPLVLAFHSGVHCGASPRQPVKKLIDSFSY